MGADGPVDGLGMAEPATAERGAGGVAGAAAAMAVAHRDKLKELPWWRRALSRTFLPNPGSYENINDEASFILRPILFDGVQFNMQLPVTPVFSLGHSLEMGSASKPPMYAFSANYLSNALVLISRVDMTGRLNGRMFATHGPSLTSKVMAEASSEPHSSRFTYDLDHRGSDASTQLKIGNGAIAAVSYLQSVTPTIAMGGELFYQGKNRFSALTAAAKYSSGDETATLTLASFGPVIVSYVKKVSPRVSLATELFWDARSRETLVTAGYRFDLRAATVVAQADSSGRVAATLEEKLNPGLSFLLSGEIDHVNQKYSFGYGLNIGQ